MSCSILLLSTLKFLSGITRADTPKAPTPASLAFRRRVNYIAEIAILLFLTNPAGSHNGNYPSYVGKSFLPFSPVYMSTWERI